MLKRSTKVTAAILAAGGFMMAALPGQVMATEALVSDEAIAQVLAQRHAQMTQRLLPAKIEAQTLYGFQIIDYHLSHNRFKNLNGTLRKSRFVNEDTDSSTTQSDSQSSEEVE